MKTLHALFRSRRLWLAGLVAVLASSMLAAQTPAARITQAIDEASRTTLKGNVSALTHFASDQGVASASTSLTHVRLLIKRTDAQEAALRELLAAQQQKSSASYHKWLTPAQFGALYGISDADLAQITAWLQANGLTVTSVGAGRQSIEVSGKVSAFEAAFKTSIHSYSRNGEQFYANATEPTIPSALSGVVAGVAHIGSYKPHSYAVLGPRATYDTTEKRLVPASSSLGVHSNLNGTDSSSNKYLFVVPGDAATIYNSPNSALNANYSGTSYTGSGVTIGVGGDAAITTAPVVKYRSLFLGDSTAPTITNVDGVTDTSDALESYLDLEVSAAMAPGATIHYYPSSDLTSGMEQAINDNLVDIFTLSFGECEWAMSSSDNAYIKELWQQAAAQGIAVTVSSGDSGSAGCDNPNSVYSSSYGLAVNGLGSTPYNISVGGTSFELTQSNFSTYANTSTTSSIYYRTAKNHIPEMTWNDSVISNGALSANQEYLSSGYTNIWAGSGGKSDCASNTTTYDSSGNSYLGSCTAGYSKPSWQRGTGVPSDGVRDLPDVSFLADDGTNYAFWTVCANYTSNNTAYTCTSLDDVVGVGGTSAATPAFAGMLAVVQQYQGGGRLGMAAANLYNLFNNSSHASSIFHDITVGNISVPCTLGSYDSSSDCALNSESQYFMTGYDSTTGYDLATGLGSVDLTALATYWSEGIGSAVPTVTVTPGSSTLTTSNALNVTVTVAGSSNTPTGTITLSSGSSYTSSAYNLNSGSVSITIPAGSLAAGTDTITASYSGDGIYADKTGTTSVTVTSSTLTSTTTSISASDTSVTYGSSVTLTALVTPAAATGTVSFYNGTSLLGQSTLSAGSASYTTTALPIGSDSVKAVYLGDSSYASSTSSTETVTVSTTSSGGSGTGSFTLSATNVTVAQGSSGSSTITITPSSFTGTIAYNVSTNATSLASYGCYTLSSTAITAANTAVNTTMTLYTSSTACASISAKKSGAVHYFSGKMQQIGSNQRLQRGNPLPLGMVSVAALLLIGLRKRAKIFATLGCLLLAGALGMSLTACGGGGTSSSSSTNYVTKGTYTVELTGYSSTNSSTNYTTDFTLTVD